VSSYITSLSIVRSLTAVVDSVLEEPAVASAPVLPADKASVLRQLEKTNPESLALAREWTDIIRNFVKVDTALKMWDSNSLVRLHELTTFISHHRAENESNSNPALGLMHLHHRSSFVSLPPTQNLLKKAPCIQKQC
jgi:hypothetical protein